MNTKTNENQLKHVANWDKANPEKKKKSRSKYETKKYINQFANKVELEELEKFIEERRKQLDFN